MKPASPAGVWFGSLPLPLSRASKPANGVTRKTFFWLLFPEYPCFIYLDMSRFITYSGELYLTEGMYEK
jgi:hypothetical protein